MSEGPGGAIGNGVGGWGPGSASLALPASQLEKVLQQGDISECCEPYMVMKEVDAAKVSMRRPSGVVKGRSWIQ